MPACNVPAVDAGGDGIVKPPTEMKIGAPVAPSQLGAAVLPVPGKAWQLEQSWLPGALLNVE